MKNIYNKVVAGGTDAVCDWINKNDLVDQVVSIVKERDYQYSIFYIGKFEHYNPITEPKE